MKRLKTLLQYKLTFIILLIFIIFYVVISTVIIKYESKITGETLTGVIIDIDYATDKVTFVLKSSEKIKCTYYLNDNEEFKYKNLLGKTIKITGNSKEVSNNTIPNTFNYKKYLYNNHIYLNFIVDDIQVIKNENILYKIKNQIINKINSYDEITKTYLNLFILGDKSYLNDDMYNNYQSNGIWHLFAISGMHISLIISGLDKLLKKAKFKNILIISCLFYFMFLTGFSASVQRTTVFYVLKKLLKYFNINLSNEKLLILTAVIILLIDPFLIYNAGFQYSFLISFAIMLESKYITGNYFVKILKISILSFIVSLPISINMNYEINLLSILLNVIYVPFITFIVFPISILTFIFPFLNFILEIMIFILEISNEVFYNLKVNLIIPKIPVYIILFYYILIVIFHFQRKKKYLVIIGVLIVLNILIPKLDNNYYVFFLDVGQGDSSVLITAYKKDVIMIDTGGLINSNYHVSDNTITFLKSLGISHIDSLIITHGDYDHMGEAINLVTNFKVNKVILNCGEFNDLESELIKVLDKKKIPYYSCITELNIDSNKLYFLNNKLYDNENDNSNVIYTELNNYKLLLMGDAGIEVEEDILEKYNLTDIDILKVGHHGSKTSSSKDFIDSINTIYSVISVGKNNRYGHPNDGVLNNLEGSKVYRTDLDGSVIFKINKDNLNVEICAP